LIWRPLRTLVRFVLVDHSTRGRSIFITTDLSLAPSFAASRLLRLPRQITAGKASPDRISRGSTW
jgi:hypothetical protein